MVLVKSDGGERPLQSAAGPLLGMTRVTLYTRVGCCLCDEAKQVLRRGSCPRRVRVRRDRYRPASRVAALYNEEVPVIAIDGRKAFKHKISMDEF
jgi:glutaredoxin